MGDISPPTAADLDKRLGRVEFIVGGMFAYLVLRILAAQLGL